LVLAFLAFFLHPPLAHPRDIYNGCAAPWLLPSSSRLFSSVLQLFSSTFFPTSRFIFHKLAPLPSKPLFYLPHVDCLSLCSSVITHSAQAHITTTHTTYNMSTEVANATPATAQKAASKPKVAVDESLLRRSDRKRSAPKEEYVPAALPRAAPAKRRRVAKPAASVKKAKTASKKENKKTEAKAPAKKPAAKKADAKAPTKKPVAKKTDARASVKKTDAAKPKKAAASAPKKAAASDLSKKTKSATTKKAADAAKPKATAAAPAKNGATKKAAAPKKAAAAPASKK
ncbi:hypothetical protein BX070DRAFT_25718, partial [Coemansia spiralis]